MLSFTLQLSELGPDDLGDGICHPLGRKAREYAAEEGEDEDDDEEEDDDDESGDEEEEGEEEEALTPGPVDPSSHGRKRPRQAARPTPAETIAQQRLAQLDLDEEDADVALPKAEGYISFPSLSFIFNTLQFLTSFIFFLQQPSD